MKAIIIDDEKHVREGLLLLAEWDKHGIHTILEAEDGDEAIELITEHRPEIIFTDMRMPKRDGINLLRWLHATDLKSKTIVVSGYDDFEYMRNAIFYKSFDYILKPIEPDVLNETLDKAVKEWNEQARSRKTQVEENRVMNEAKPLYWDRLFSSLCAKASITTEMKEKVENEFGIAIAKLEKTVALIPIKPIVMKSFQGDRDLAFFTLSNICNELLRKQNDGVCFRNGNKEEELVILFWNEKNVTYLLEEIHSLIYQYSKLYTIIALGEKSRKINEAYESALQVYQKHPLVDQKKIVTHKDVKRQPMLHLLDHSNELKWAIRSGSGEQVQSQLDGIFSRLETGHGLSLEQLEVWESQFELLRNNWLKEYEIQHPEPFYKGQDYWNEDGSFSFRKFKEQKAREFSELIHILSKSKYQREKNNMQQIEEYLQQHYQEDINLQDIADRFYLSREYISRKFKQDHGSTITDYVTNIRMEKAKKLLENPYLKIYEVAYGVGYGNEKYFSKVFKKHAGVTPNEYRHAQT
ncbi:DNA-binding response regulator [Bacillus sp. AFS015802]|uniref:response regulator transcription factor n=1 Tax=Bacillus sp. AFS015802 TaxID=2033486 RepID=UPI000BF72AAD|nr:response regulator [Bacillus sp. AFS015802]PFA69531.1 DNA-binding response regulator [Bacillus sp. AFS015802]